MKKNNIELCKQDKEYYTQILEKYYLIYTQYLTPIIDKMKNDFLEIQKDAKSCYELSDMADLFFTAENSLISAWICTEYQKWQQLICLHISHEKFMAGIQIEKCVKDNENINLKFLEETYKISSFDSWKKINEMRLVVNVIKHFTGNSYVKLKVLRQDLFEIFDEFDVRKIAVGSGEFRLNLTSDDYCSYHKSLVKFWDELYVAINTGKD